MVSLLVTGGCGFLRSCFINHYFPAEKPLKLINLDSLSVNNIASSIQEDPNYHAVKGKLRNGDLIHYLLKKHAVTHVIHFADYDACDVKDPLTHTNDVICGAHLLMETCHNYATIPYIHVSLKTEDSVLLATNNAAELILNAYAERYNIPLQLLCITDVVNVPKIGRFL